MSGLNCALGLSSKKYSCSAPTVIFTLLIPRCPSVFNSFKALPSTASNALNNGVFKSKGVPSNDKNAEGINNVPPLGLLTMNAGDEISQAE